MSRWVSELGIQAGHGGNGRPAFSTSPSHPFTHHLSHFRKQSTPNPPPPSASASASEPSSSSHRSSFKISPPLLCVIVAAVVVASGILYFLIRFLKNRRGSGRYGSADPSSGGHHRRRRNPASPSAIQRQLQQLFTLNDGGGLDQATIDALPAFVYTELRGSRAGAAAEGPPGEPLDCAVCLCEFSPTDRLRLLPACGHAFHLACIDAWLTSSSTCPLCRGAAISLHEDAGTDLEDDWKDLEEAAVSADNDDEKVVFPVRLGKFRSVQGGADVKQGSDNGGEIAEDEGEATSSSWKIDERRCYSMGSYQYVLQDSALSLPLSNCGGGPRRRVPVASGGGVQGRRLCVAGKGESFSVSKIWQWSNNKGQNPLLPSLQMPLPSTSSSPTPAKEIVD